MRRLAILFAILAAVSAIEHIVLSGAFSSRWTPAWHAPRRIGHPWMSLSEWRAFLIGPIRLLQRKASRHPGPWLGQSN
jgi:hypothetical protein